MCLHDSAVIAEDHDPDVVGLEVERHALEARRELDHLTLRVWQALHEDLPDA